MNKRNISKSHIERNMMAHQQSWEVYYCQKTGPGVGSKLFVAGTRGPGTSFGVLFVGVDLEGGVWCFCFFLCALS